MAENNKTFEESMLRLEQIVRIMEKGEVSLEESMELFREGTSLVQRCGKMLDNAELEIQKVAVGVDGKPVEEAFEDDV